jgi:hypothetical protein
MKDMDTAPPLPHESAILPISFSVSGARAGGRYPGFYHQGPPPISFDLRKWVTGVAQTCRPADEVALTV